MLPPVGPGAPPAVVILSPGDGVRALLGQDVSVRSWVRDDIGLLRVELWIDGAAYNAYDAGRQPIVEVVQTWRADSPGRHVLEVRAYDVARQVSAPARITVYVDVGPPAPGPLPPGPPTPQRDTTAPSVYIVSPTPGQPFTAGQSFNVVAVASDSAGVVSVELWVDGVLYASEGLPQPRQSWQWVKPWASTIVGNHTLIVRARDTANNRGDSAPVLVTVRPASGPGPGPAPQPGGSTTGRLYFSSQQSGNLDIYSIRPNGSELTRLTNAAQPEVGAAVSSDGQMLAYERDGQIWVAQTSGGGAHVVISNPNPADAAGSPAWSSDRQSLGFIQNNQIWIYSMVNGTRRQVTTDGYVNDGPSFAANGAEVACFSWRGKADSDIYVLSLANGSVVRAFNSHPGSDTTPSYSPDGSRLVFARTGGGNPGIYSMRADGNNLVKVANQGWSPVWSPDGRQIAFLVQAGAQADLWVMDAGGGNARRVLGGVAMDRIAWGR